MSKYADKDFGTVAKDASKLMEFLECRATEHGHYYHYSTVERIDKILNSKTFWLTPSVLSNDGNDRNNNIYNLCFTSGSSENLPLWYLYAGADGKGGRVGITKANLKKIVKESKFKLCQINGDGELSVVDEIDNKMVDVYDVLYIQRGKSSRAKYNGKTENSISNEVVEHIFKSRRNMTKGLIWFYEKETRISVDFNKTRICEGYAEQIKLCNEEYVVVAEIPDKVYSAMKITWAPNVTEDDVASALKKVGLEQWFTAIKGNDEKLRYSEYQGSIEFRMKNSRCDNCEKYNSKNQ